MIKSLKNKSLLQTLLLTCLVLLLIVIFSFVATHVISSRILNNQVRINEKLLSQNVIFEVDNTFAEFSNIQTLFENDTNICDIRHTEEEMFLSFSEIQYLNATISKQQTDGRKVYLYFNDEDEVVGSTGTSKMSSFLEKNPLSSDIKYDIMYSTETSYYQCTTSSYPGFFLYISPLAGNGNIKLLIMENSDVLLQRLDSLRDDATLEYIIADNYNKTILTSKNFTNLLQSDILSKYYRNGTFNFDGKNFIVIHTQSQQTQLQYTLAISNHKTVSELSFFKKISISIIMTTSLLILFLLFLIIMQSRRPMHEILSYLPHSSYVDISKKDELDTIKQAIFDIRNEAALSKSENSELIKKLEDEILLKLILNRKLSNKEYTQASKLFNMQDNGLRVIVIQLSSADKLFADEDMTDEERKYNAMFIMKNIFDELLETQSLLFDDKLISIVPSLNSIETLSMLISMGQNVIKSNFDIEYLIAISNTVESIDDLSAGYYYALSILGSAKGTKNIPAILTQPLYFDTDISDYCYNANIEQSLLQTFRSRQTDECVDILNKIFSTSSNLPIETSLVERCAYFGIIGTILRFISNTKEIIKFTDIFEQIEELLTINNIQYGKDLLYSICSDLCSITLKTDENIITKISKIVADEYQNPELSVGYIADTMNLHPVYLSSLFKSHNEYGLLEFINRFRINKAKTILSETPTTIEAIAEQVGYTNSKTFSRVFKKYEGLSPAKYRDSLNK